MSRRALSLALVLQTIVMLLLPAYALASQSARIPACCRRAGLHHCAMDISLPGEGFRAVPCAKFPSSGHALLSQNAATPAASTTRHVLLREYRTQTAMRIRAHDGVRARQDSRGPPSLA